MKTILLTLAALLAISGSAAADIQAHAVATLPDGSTHTLDATIGDDGTATVLVDGAPVGAPAVPALPVLP
ncbi:MAG: hypothetical protein QOE90_3230 [Thermoplasmata archaeon]|jgi:hypothetical protein|nr:hypothetical protein [Thermoplasmata archaeon]